VIRTQVELTDSQARELEELALKEGVTMAELVRQSIEHFLAERNDDQRWERALSAIGRFHEGPSDVSQHHDTYLADDFS
jgi:Arc/MetJ-type ribon-helix-helix transcriptional regulator